MKDLLKENNQQKHQFKSYYCAKCRQSKPCQLLTGWSSELKNYCCQCYYEGERDREVEYSSLEKVLVSKQKERVRKIRQLQILRGYLGCSECGSKEVDAYNLYVENKLVCQPCLVRETGGSSSPISFLGQRKWFQKRWRINLDEWLTNHQSLPVNAECAREWLKDKEHLSNCACLEQEAKEVYLLVNDNLKRCQEQLKECQCEVSPKVRVDSDDYAWCEKCKVSISAASKKRVIKNRNDPRF
ncbi:7904_t:CDS:1 [Funneliformis geosporum]|uniref:3726_t:CDS:1 n=1 Tax=Funneliformis geosporum TaxID=1117311 RepID=A0A9W4SYL3_9GLOM|nr:3726_t:CDS:1 [Funneliformis geosporum]CAI2186460.1 7904_t:CDS:1 [Funneliformis geosporum]